MSELLKLAERCEAYDPKLSPDNRADELALHQDIVMATGEGTLSPAFETTFVHSLDAAMTLVPEGWRLRQMNYSAPCADDRKWHLNLHGGSVGQDTFVGRGATPALALCAAALRARAAKP